MEVVVTEEFIRWYNSLNDQHSNSVLRVVDLLEAKGVTLGFPYSSQIQDTEMNLRELRIQSGGDPLRVFYSFDPDRNAVVILGGNKAGNDRFYEEMLPVCEYIWSEYLAENFDEDE